MAKDKKPLIGWKGFTIVSVIATLGALNYLVVVAFQKDVVGEWFYSLTSFPIHNLIVGLAGLWTLIEIVNMFRK